MLQAIRKHVHGLLGWLVFGLIIVSFALWGISSYFSGGDEVPVATVGDKKFYQRDVNRAYLRLKQSSPKLAAMDENILRKEAIRQLVADTVLGVTVDDMGLEVSDDEVKKIIQGIPVFQVDGKFDKNTYTVALNGQGMSSRQFIEQTRLALKKDQLRRSVLDSGFMTDAELQNYYKLFDQSRDVEYLTVPLELKNLEQSDEAIQAYYDQHKNRFQVPEQVSLHYVELKLDDLAAKESVSDDDLKAYYDEQKESLTTQERRKVRHILVAVNDDVSDQEALTKAQDIYQKLKAGEEFADLAKQLSDDPLSGKKGGDLGFIRQGDMVKAFEDVAFTVAENDISEPVKSDYGYHVIQVTEIEPGQTKTFAEVKDQLLKDYRRQKVENTFFELQETLDQTRYEHTESLEMAAQAIDQTILETALFNQNTGQGIASEKAVREAAFSQDVLDGNNSDLIELGDERVVVVRIKEHKPATTKPLESVKQSIIQALNQKDAHEAAVSKADAIVKAVKDGKSLESVAAEYQLNVETPGFIKRDTANIDWPLKQGIFSAPKPAENQTTTTTVDLGPGGQAVVVIKSVKPGDQSNIEESTQNQVTGRMLKNQNSLEYTTMLNQLKTNSDVTVQKELQ
ncbi:MAG: SurA N-terminal domain-containing protein [Gammaproteobacteria bacterium]|nr:SurA N-terminal domain-containing protein [Gammaproteobacteria bacterium]